MDFVTVKTGDGEATAVLRDVEPGRIMVVLSEDLAVNAGDPVQIVWSEPSLVIAGIVRMRTASALLIDLDAPIETSLLQRLTPTSDVARSSGTVDLSEITGDFGPKSEPDAD